MPSSSFPPLVWPPMVSRRHFCARIQRGRREVKRKASVKAICRPARRPFRPVVSPIFPLTKTAHSGPHSATQGIKQPRPTPSGASRGIIICCGPEIARRNGTCRHPTRRSGGRHTARRYTPRGAARHQCGTLSRQPSVLRPDRAAQ